MVAGVEGMAVGEHGRFKGSGLAFHLNEVKCET